MATSPEDWWKCLQCFQHSEVLWNVPTQWVTSRERLWILSTSLCLFLYKESGWFAWCFRSTTLAKERSQSSGCSSRTTLQRSCAYPTSKQLPLVWPGLTPWWRPLCGMTCSGGWVRKHWQVCDQVCTDKTEGLGAECNENNKSGKRWGVVCLAREQKPSVLGCHRVPVRVWASLNTLVFHHKMLTLQWLPSILLSFYIETITSIKTQH